MGEYRIWDGGDIIRETDDVLEWGRYFENKSTRRIASDNVGGAWISTVFVGIGHNFETIVFKDGTTHEEVGRCDTAAEARSMHCRTYRRYKAS